MLAFDGNDYRKRVMSRLLADNAAADPETGDPFLVCDVPPDATDDEIRSRLDAVLAFWQKERNHPRYKGIAAQLVSRKDAYAAILFDPVARAAARDRVFGERAREQQEAIDALDRLAGSLVTRYRGIPRSRVPRLEQAARRRGVSAADFAGWLAGQQLVDTADESVPPWDSGVRRQVRAALDELASLSGERAKYRTLWTFLDLASGASNSAIADRYDALLGENQAGRHDRARTLTGDLLGHVKTRLMVDGGGEGYEASLRADARDSITGEIEEVGLLTGELSAGEVAALTARIVGWQWGISTAEARDIVTAAAGAHGVATAVGGDVELVVCARCRNPQPAGADGLCRYCGAELFVTCPSCGTRIEAAAEVCPNCHVDLAEYRAAAVRAEWAAVTGDLAANRLWSAATRLARLVLDAPQSEAPDGRSPLDWQAEVAADQRRVSEAVRAASAMATSDPVVAEAALTAVLADAVDCPEAVAALERLPLPVPDGLIASAGRDAVELSWSPSETYAGGTYRIARVAGDRTTGLGTTSATAFTDGGAPSGVPLRYEVVHTIGARRSQPARSAELLLLRDVASVTAQPSGDGMISLTWPDAGTGGELVIERSVADGTVRSPTRRIKPTERGRYLDRDPQRGVVYRYRVFVEYSLPTGRHATTGASGVASAVGRPVAVVELWIDPSDDGSVSIGYPRPSSGVVILVAADGPQAAPFGEPGEQLSQEQLDDRLARARVLSRGERRARDRSARGRVVYTAITGNGTTAVVGASGEYVATAPITGLVAREVGHGVLLDFEWPLGVTEAAVLWRSDQFPTSPDDATASSSRITNTRMQIDQGFLVPVATNVRPLYVAVFPLVRLGGSGSPVPVARSGAAIQAR